MAKIGKYELIKKLATGGMAEVFLAKVEWARGLEKTVVVKRILQHMAEDPAFIEMFFSEAQLAAQLNHPNIAQIIDFGESDGVHFLAMEYVDGPSLRALASAIAQCGDRFPLGPAVRIVASACEALAYAHDLTDSKTGDPLQLVHRDVSPDNVLVSKTGAVKLVDFGIAKAVTQAHHTKTGLVKGKLAYMSPEQLRAEPLDRRSDIFALGVVLYELLAGARPFQAKNEVTLIHAMLFEEGVPLQERRPDCPPELVKIVDRAREKECERRYATCQQMYDDLERFLVSLREPASHFQIAQLVRQYLPAEAKTQATPPRPFEPLAQTDTIQPPLPAPATSEFPSMPRTAVEKPAPVSTKVTPVPQAITSGRVQPSERPSPEWRGRRPILVAAGVGILLAAGAAGLLMRGSTPPPPAPAPPVAIAPAPVAPSGREANHKAAADFLEQAQKLLKGKDPRKAEVPLLACLALEPENVECHYVLGVLYSRLRDPERAATHLREALRLAPDDPRAAQVRQALAEAKRTLPREILPAVGSGTKPPIAGLADGGTSASQLATREKGPPRADANPANAIQLASGVASQPDAGQVPAEQASPSVAQKMYEDGKVLLRRGQYKDAQTFFARCLWLDSSYAECHLGLGAAYAGLNDPENSTSHYREFLRLAPDHKRAADVRRLLADYEARVKQPNE